MLSKIRETTEKPFVFIIDIDGTIIGDIKPQVMLYEMNIALKREDKKINVFNVKEFQNKLQSGIVRPYFSKFIKKIKENYSNAEYFVYTASEKQWATFLVPHIEKALNIKINRPIFTRQHCSLVNNSIQKSIKKISPDILKTLRRKYGNIKSLEDKYIIIDNIAVYEANDQPKMLICPTYDFKLPENLPAIINERIFKNHREIVLGIINKYVILPETNTYLEFQQVYYTYYIKYISNILRSNNFQSRDKFFLYLLNIILYKKINNFSVNTVSYIGKKINNKIQETR